MNRLFFIFSIISVLLSCSKESESPVVFNEEGCAIYVGIDGLDLGTKASDVSKETVITDGQLMCFNESGELYRYQKLSASEIAATSVKISNMKVGKYTLALVVNGPDLNGKVTTLSGLKSQQLALKDYNGTTTDFVMFGSAADVSVTADAVATTNIVVSRHVGRVLVTNITNNIPSAYGNLEIIDVMLTNVYANVTMEGKKVSSGEVWYNIEGRSDNKGSLNKDHIIDGSTYKSQCPDLTYQSINKTISNTGSYSNKIYLYAYCNDSANVPSGFVTDFNGQKTCLVVKAKFNGHIWYYPVVIDAIVKNTSYGVTLNIVGEGSTDPNTPVKKGSIQASIVVQDWQSGGNYDKTI